MHATFIAINLVVAALAIVSFAIGVYHFSMTADNIKHEKRTFVHSFLFGRFPFWRSQLADDGIYHQKKALLFILCFGALLGLGAILVALESQFVV